MERLTTQRSTTTSKRASKDDEHLPLHAVPGIKTLNCNAIRSLATQFAARRDDGDFRALVRRFNVSVQFVETGKPFRERCSGPDKDRRYVSHVSSADIEKLLEADIIEESKEPPLRTGRLFSVLEAKKRRRRSIFWPKWLNFELGDVPTPLLADVIASALNVRPGTFARTFDLASSFYQVELAPDVRDYFGFRTADGKIFRLKRMPMGSTTAPEILQVIMQIITHIAMEGCAALVDSIVHIDNVRFSGENRNTVNRVSDRFMSLCRTAGITLNEDAGNILHQEGEFLGMWCDYSAGTVRCTDATLEKLHSRAASAFSTGATVQDCLSLFGSLSFCSRVLRVAPAAHYAAYKFIRRLASKFQSGTVQLGDSCAWWSCAKHDFEQWLAEVAGNAPTRHTAPDHTSEPLVLVSDASLTGWGAILCNESTGDCWQAQGRWPSRHICDDINTLEMTAISLALEAFADELYDKRKMPLIILVDNSSSAAVLRKGTAREYFFNAAALRCLRNLAHAADRPVSVAHIMSEENLADCLSRGTPLLESSEELSSTLGAFGRRLGRSALRVRVPREYLCSQG